MKRPKDETLSIRTSSEVKQLLRMAAEKERRSIASMVEVLILKYAREQGWAFDKDALGDQAMESAAIVNRLHHRT